MSEQDIKVMVTLKLKGQKISFTVEELKELQSKLNSLLGNTWYYTYPYPYPYTWTSGISDTGDYVPPTIEIQ